MERDHVGGLKEAVRAHWENEPCGTRDLPSDDRDAFFARLERERYELEPYIPGFARFEEARGKKVLEIGVGAGSDFVNWARHGAEATGVDLTEHALRLTGERLQREGLRAELRLADAEHLAFPDESFDLVYSWGVLHHTPDTRRAIGEVHRVLKPGGRALIMLYRVPSWTGFALWSLHCLSRLRPWQSAKWAIGRYLESPGTKAYTDLEARQLFHGFAHVSVRRRLSHGDLLLMRAGTRYRSWPYRLIWRLYPRWMVRLTGDRLGFYLLIEAIR